jgi:hypothetical protein
MALVTSKLSGETRVNLVRVAALIAFYGYHIVNVFSNRTDPELAGVYHVQATGLALVWALGCIAIHLAIVRAWISPALPYVTTAWDLLLLTTLLVLGGGPRSPLVVLYFVLITAAPLRGSVGAVVLACAGAILGYLFVLGHYVYVVIGYDRYYSPAFPRIPRADEAILVLALAFAGILTGQTVRAFRRSNAAAESDTAAASGLEQKGATVGVVLGSAVMAVLLSVGIVFAIFLAPEQHQISDGAYFLAIALIAAFLIGGIASAILEFRRLGLWAVPPHGGIRP